MDIKDLQIELEDERKTLEDKRDRLKVIAHSKLFYEFDITQKCLIDIQLRLMGAYERVLDLRIDLINQAIK